MLYKQFVVWNCNGYSIAPLTDFIHSPVFQELPDEDKYFGNGSDKRIYIDLRDSYGYTSEMEKPTRNDSKMVTTIKLKNPLVRKMRLRPWGYTNGGYLCMLLDSSLTFKYKTYSFK